MRSGTQLPPYRVLVVADDDELVDDLRRHLAVRPIEVFFVEAGPAVRVLTQRRGLRFIAFAKEVTRRLRSAVPTSQHYQEVAIGDPSKGIEQAFGRLREATQSEGAQEFLSVGIVGLPLEYHRAASRFLRQSTFRMAAVYSREDALDPKLLGSADLVLLDSKLGEIDRWSVVPRLISRDPGAGLPVFGIVPRIDVDLLRQSVEHSVAGFLLRSLIDGRLFPRLEGVARSGLRVRPEGLEPDPRYEYPWPAGESEDLLSPDGAHEDELELAAARQIFHTLSEQPGAADERAQALLGLTFGKARLEQVIGRGGSGTVYLGWHQTLGTTVAVKVLFAEDVARDPRFAHRFIEEARIAACIEHPNIIRVIDFDRDDESGCYYLVMEMVRGASLLQLIRTNGALDELALLTVAEKVAEVLAVAQQVGIVHRDITPANIMITDRNHVKLADLGIAKFIDGAQGGQLGREGTLLSSQLQEMLSSCQGVPVQTATGVLLGTPQYISPEQARDARLVDFQCDMYSLGASLYHAATRFPPFGGVTIEELLTAHREAPIPDPRSITPELSAGTARLIMRLMAKEPGQRFVTYDLLLETIALCRRRLQEREMLADMATRGWRGKLASFCVKLLAPWAR